MMSALGVRGEPKGHVVVVRVDMGTVWGTGRGVCREREWGLTFCMWSAMPRYIIMLPDSTSFRYRSRQMLKSHLKIELHLCAGSRGTWAPAMQRYTRCLVDAKALRPRKDKGKSATGA